MASLNPKHRAVLRVQEAFTNPFGGAIAREYKRLGKQWNRSARELFEDPSALDDVSAGFLQEHEPKLNKIMNRFMTSIMKEVHKFQMAELGLTSKDPIFSTTKAAIPRLATKLADTATGQTMTRTQRIIDTGNSMVAADEGPLAGLKYVRDRLQGGIAKRRSTNIAKTEGHTAGNAIIQLIGDNFQSKGDKAWKTWMSRRDGKVRLTHARADGQTVRMNETFTVGGVELHQPGDPSGPAAEVINCRCYILVKRRPGKRKAA